ncbi:SMI1/KNR4 family protein [Neisseria musculi]|uniref:SMI1 / KNR4 family protein n=1 Tax=Neisseria musculi TaxID=1815583 RepID=A0A7H1MDB5_9NEIS|nr:SMI1/KNR4 family protein [Neisseria musculi]QNT59630.1 SMI1 / KNR4 family protein [Neisseria musculi]
MRNLKIWRDYGALNKSLINEFAEKTGVVFPKSYIILLSKHDYLYPEENTFRFTNNDGEIDERDIVFFGYKQNYLEGQDIYSYSKIDDDYSYGKKIIAFGGSANGDYICFDYRRNNKDPSIILMSHDDFYEDEEGNTKMVTNHIADSFDDFLEMLYEPLD